MAFREFDAPQLSRRSLFRSGAWLSVGAVAAGVPGASALMAHDVGHAFPEVAKLADNYVSQRKVANLLVYLGRGQEDMAHTVGGGKLAFGSDANVGEDSLYRIYSMTKPITGMATMMCVEDGHFGLDTPLAEILPAFSDMQVLKTPDGALDDTVPAETQITIRQLLTHTSGLSYIIDAKGPLLAAFAENGLVGGRVSRMPIPGLPEVDAAPSLEVFADRLATLPLVAQPGTKWIYSASLDLLGRVIEVASGQSFEEFLTSRIFEPCGMTSTYFTVPESERSRMTTNYGFLGDMPIPIDPGPSSVFLDKPSFPAGGGGLVSSPRDYDRFLQMLLGYGQIDGVQVMESDTVRTGVSNILPAGVDTTGSWIEGEGFGAGGRSSNGSYGWGGAAGTLAAADFRMNMRTGLYTQYMPPEKYPIRQQFIEALATDLMAAKAAA
ncbi:serine hydrolase domain-containing protein [Qipengyuania gelatinilytica]|uniref:Beta-lactamase family protein n=1 Tax=Qipengyuania gelatinilytica TaxID=2867231 RepID=A0ABX9A447_9SPHN|nr:serine hydrolase domain-containing protein [Qipengyuania gelatinilytica]QZD94979.1 beta-lactamase family protein [Qipengyuania gelatinilytica]